MSIGGNIKKARGRIKQEELAEMLGVNTVTVSRWENDKYTPNANMLRNIAHALNTSVEYLIATHDDIKDLKDSLSNEDIDMKHSISGGTDGNMFIIDTGEQKYYFPNDEEGRKLFMTVLAAGLKGMNIPVVSNSINGDNNNGNKLGVINN